MDFEDAKQLIADATGYKAKAKSLATLQKELTEHLGHTKIGSDILNLGMNRHFYVKANGIAHFVTAASDFTVALINLKNDYNAVRRAVPAPAKIRSVSQRASKIAQAINEEVRHLDRLKRLPELPYQDGYDPRTRRKITVGDQVVEDLLKGDFTKAASTIRNLMLYISE